jgi:hypothetical protein
MKIHLVNVAEIIYIIQIKEFSLHKILKRLFNVANYINKPVKLPEY